MAKALVENDWQTECDLDAVCRAKAVERDPKRMEKCKLLAKKKLDDNKSKLALAQTLVDMGEGKNP